MKQFIKTCSRINIITYPKLKHKMLKFQFITIRTNVTRNTTKMTNITNLETSIFLTIDLVSDFDFCLKKEQFGLM